MGYVEKGELIASYNEESAIEEQIKQIKEEWDEYHPGERMPDDSKLAESIWEGDFVQVEWDFFCDEVNTVLDELNPSGCWDSPEFEEGAKCYEKPMELIDDLINFEYYRYGIQKLDIYKYKTGILVDPQWKTEKIALPECEEGYFRDWDRDGICVRRRDEDYW